MTMTLSASVPLLMHWADQCGWRVLVWDIDGCDSSRRCCRVVGCWCGGFISGWVFRLMVLLGEWANTVAFTSGALARWKQGVCITLWPRSKRCLILLLCSWQCVCCLPCFWFGKAKQGAIYVCASKILRLSVSLCFTQLSSRDWAYIFVTYWTVDSNMEILPPRCERWLITNQSWFYFYPFYFSHNIAWDH